MAKEFPYAVAVGLDEQIKKGFSALELPFLADTAREIGIIVGHFAVIERYVPQTLARLAGTSDTEAAAITSVFRSFSNKLEVIGSVLKSKPFGVERSVASHCKGLFTDANRIRNEYAHARYRFDGEVKMAPYSDEKNERVLTMAALVKDRQTMNRIQWELNAIYNQRQLPAKLHKQLLKQFPSGG